MNQKITQGQLVEVLAKLSEKLSPKKFSQEVASFLLREKRTGELDSLARELIVYRASKGLVEVTAVSAHWLAPAALNQIKRQVKQLYPAGRQIIINQQIDQNQIGGVRLELPDKQLDLTLKSKLNKFKQLTAGN